MIGIAIHKAGDLRPEARTVVEELLGRPLLDIEQVSLIASVAHGMDAAVFHDLCNEIAAIPGESAVDGLSNRDHDRVLYGERKWKLSDAARLLR